MKVFTLLIAGSMSLFALQSRAVVIDNRTVYNPQTNICMSSFGGYINSFEVLNMDNHPSQIAVLKSKIVNWIYEENDPGFYVQEFDQESFYWQIVDSKKHIGVVLLIAEEGVNEKFYTELGAGLNHSGKMYYGLNTPKGQNGEVFSFVVDKSSMEILHFENWKFSDGVEAPSWMTRSETTQLLNRNEYLKYKLIHKKSDKLTTSGIKNIAENFYRPLHFEFSLMCRTDVFYNNKGRMQDIFLTDINL